LGGGKAAEYHLYGGLAVVAAVEVGCGLSEEATRSSGLLCSQAAHYYSTVAADAPDASVASAASDGAPSTSTARAGPTTAVITTAPLASLVLTRPVAIVKARGPRRECLGGAALAAQGDGYVPNEILIGGNPSLGCALAFCLADLWPQLLAARRSNVRRTVRSSAAAGSVSVGLALCPYLKLANDTYSLSMNNYNKNVKGALGHGAYKGVHLENCVRNWYQGVQDKIKRPGQCINVFDSIPFYDPDPAPTTKDTVHTIAGHFGVSAVEFLSHLKPHAQLTRRSLPADAAAIDLFMDGKEFAEAGAEASMSPNGKLTAGFKDDVASLQQQLRRGCLCTGLGFVFHGYDTTDVMGNTKRTDRYAGEIYVIEVTFKSPTSSTDPRQGLVSHHLLTHHSGGTRDSQSSSIRAPSDSGLQPQSVPRDDKEALRLEVAKRSAACKAAVGAVKDDAEERLRRGWPRTRGTGVINLRDSLRREVDKRHIDAIVAANGLDAIMTAVPNFFTLDPDHTFFPNVKYAKEHHFKGLKT